MPGNGTPIARSIRKATTCEGIPAPEEVAIAADLMEQALAGLDETYVQVFHMRLQQCTEEEIAAALGCNRAFVRTRLNRIRGRLQRLLDDDGKPMHPGDLLRHCLVSPVSEYLGDLGQSAEFATDSPSECGVMDMTLGELFQRPDPPLGLLIVVKRGARRLMNPGASDMPAEVHRVIYFASIAAALVRYGEQISKSSPEVLRVAWEQLAAEPYADGWLRRLFATAQERLCNQGGSKE